MTDFGLVRATVTDNEDPDLLGRVRVRYQWLGGPSAQQQSAWARVARPQSHAGAGDWFLPEVGDEVLVGFEFNRVEAPIVLASLFTDQSAPPKSDLEGDHNQNGKNNLRFLRTKAGHLLCFDDLEGRESIRLQDSKNNRLLIESHSGKVTLEDSSGNRLCLDNEKISLEDKNGNGFELQGAEIRIRSSSSVKIETASRVEIGKGASEALVKGDSFMQLFNAHTHPTPRGPSGPPQVPMTPAQLSQKVKTA
ncbi:MAG: hypothetical protein EA369_07440 [Bradymonadales bacterium]|nr:MAG: hypothetical protein EA369_07440 [Bradymonadales bacterium]